MTATTGNIVKSNLVRVVSFPEKNQEWIDIIPGINEFNANQMQTLRKLEDFDRRVDYGDFEILHGTNKVKHEFSKEQTSALEQFNTKDAEGLIIKTFNMPLLEKWKAVETRKAVSHAIDKQIKFIEEERERTRAKKNLEEIENKPHN